jgi:hypothetical protein
MQTLIEKLLFDIKLNIDKQIWFQIYISSKYYL